MPAGFIRVSPLQITLDILSRLVSFNTETQRSNLPLVDYVADLFDRHGVPYVRLPNADGDKAAIYATVAPR